MGHHLSDASPAASTDVDDSTSPQRHHPMDLCTLELSPELHPHSQTRPDRSAFATPLPVRWAHHAATPPYQWPLAPLLPGVAAIVSFKYIEPR